MPPIAQHEDRTWGCHAVYLLMPGRLRIEIGGALQKRIETEQRLKGVIPEFERLTIHSREYLLPLALAVLSLAGAIVLGKMFLQYAYEEAGWVIAVAVPSILAILSMVFTWHFLRALRYTLSTLLAKEITWT